MEHLERVWLWTRQWSYKEDRRSCCNRIVSKTEHRTVKSTYCVTHCARGVEAGELAVVPVAAADGVPDHPVPGSLSPGEHLGVALDADQAGRVEGAGVRVDVAVDEGHILDLPVNYKELGLVWLLQSEHRTKVVFIDGGGGGCS